MPSYEATWPIYEGNVGSTRENLRVDSWRPNAGLDQYSAAVHVC